MFALFNSLCVAFLTSRDHVCRPACSVVSVVSLRPHGLYPARLLCPWNFPGKTTVSSCHAVLQGIFPTQGSNPSLLCLLHCRRSLYCWDTREASLSSIAEHFYSFSFTDHPVSLLPTPCQILWNNVFHKLQHILGFDLTDTTFSCPGHSSTFAYKGPVFVAGLLNSSLGFHL